MATGNDEVRRVFVAATRQNQGKTSVCLGLMAAFRRRFPKLGFIKPVGQRYVVVDGHQVDEDSVLIERVCHVECALSDMSPVAVERGFTERYLRQPNPQALMQRIQDSFPRVCHGVDLVVIEGTGHAGVGSVFDLSNATVARLLGAKAIMVSGGGIGQPTDEVMLNKAMLDLEGVELLGVIVNKVVQSKYAKVNELVRAAMERLGVRVFGVIPYVAMLSNPTVGLILEETDAKLLSGEPEPDNEVTRVVVGAMPPHVALDYFTEGTLVITPGSREDIILAAISSSLASESQGGVVGIMLTGPDPPHRSVMSLIGRVNIPVMWLAEDTYTATSRIHDLMVKIRPGDEKKVRMLNRLVEKYVDVDALIEAIEDDNATRRGPSSRRGNQIQIGVRGH